MIRACAGPVLLLLGCLALALQAYTWVRSGVLDSRLCGGGVGLVAIGAITWFYWIEDCRAPRVPVCEKQIPTPEEYDAAFQEIEEPRE